MAKTIQFKSRRFSQLQTQFWLRALAFSIDGYIVTITIDTLLAGMPLVRLSPTLLPVLDIIIFIIYSSLMESSRLQGSVGKWFCRFKVGGVDLHRISFQKALLRNALKVFSITSIVGVFIIDATKKRQGLHDLVAGTVLIRR